MVFDRNIISSIKLAIFDTKTAVPKTMKIRFFHSLVVFGGLHTQSHVSTWRFVFNGIILWERFFLLCWISEVELFTIGLLLSRNSSFCEFIELFPSYKIQNFKLACDIRHLAIKKLKLCGLYWMTRIIFNTLTIRLPVRNEPFVWGINYISMKFHYMKEDSCPLNHKGFIQDR